MPGAQVLHALKFPQSSPHSQSAGKAGGSIQLSYAIGRRIITVVDNDANAAEAERSHRVEDDVFRVPCSDDGPAVWKLVAECPPLDPNSVYCNLLQCTHFADTCVLVEDDAGIIGWVSAYRPPSVPGQVFVWQVAVAVRARGKRLGGRMLDSLLARPTLRDVTTLAATITEENAPSWSLFASLARRHGARMDRRPMFDSAAHFASSHASEHLVTIGPLVAGTKTA